MFSFLAVMIYSYAETHYRVVRGTSLIYDDMPEIIADAPSRSEQGQEFPIFCLVKDSDLFPITMKQVRAEVSCSGKVYQTSLFSSHLISSRFWYIIRKLRLPGDFLGEISINVRFEFIQKGKTVVICTDNLPGCSHQPLRSYISPDQLPSLPGWFCGETHCHSEKTDDQVEFGAPVEVIGEMAKAMGLKWAAITDHSYDLDVPAGKWFGVDPNLERWRGLEMEIKSYNCRNQVLLLRGEEVSCGNRKSQNVHLLLYGMSEFVLGRGDGGKRNMRGLNLKTDPDLSVEEVLKKVASQNGVAYAAHPQEGSSLLNRLFLNRGVWSHEDAINPGLTGLQIWNGHAKGGFDKSYNQWVRLLLSGHRTFAIAGSDGHGDFNRLRAVKLPFLKLCEDLSRSFGTPRTYLRCERLDEDNILEALKMGRALITNAHVAILEVSNQDGKLAQIGDNISGNRFRLKIEAKSTEEFGKLTQIVLYRGDIGSTSEDVELSLYPDDIVCQMHADFEPKQDCYLRLLALSQKGDKEYLCLTNPIWIST